MTRVAGRIPASRLLFFSIVCLLSARASAHADEEPKDQIQDPDVQAEIERAEQSNIDNATDNAAKESDRSLGDIQALIRSAKAQSAGALTDFQNKLKEIEEPGLEGFMGEQDEEALRALSQSIEKKADAETFSGKANLAGFKLPDSSVQDIESRRRGYRVADRQRDLKHDQSMLAKAEKRAKRKDAELAAEKKDFIADLRDFAAETKNLRQLVLEVVKHLDAVAAGNKPAQETSARLKDRAKQMERDASDLNREIQIFEIALKLQRIEEAAWRR